MRDFCCITVSMMGNWDIIKVSIEILVCSEIIEVSLNFEEIGNFFFWALIAFWSLAGK